MPNLTKLPLIDEKNCTIEGEPSFRCVVEAPRGSSVKLKYDPELKAFVLRRSLMKGLSYPFDWGFLPSTLGADGDPLDVMIFHDDISAVGVIMPSQIIGVLECEQHAKDEKPLRNDRFFAVPVRSHRQDSLNHVDQITKRLRKELEDFFRTSSELEDKKVEFLGWHGPKHAKELIRQGAASARRAAK